MQQSAEVKPSQSNGSPAYYSPNIILNLYSTHLRTEADNRVISIRGVYDGSQYAKEYSGYVYDKLKGESDNIYLNIKVPILLRSKLISKQIYTFSGIIEKKVKDSSVELTFSIDRVLNVEKSQYSEAEMEGFKVIQQKVAKGYIDVEAKIRESIYQNKKLRIANIYGETAIVDKDFYRGIEGAIVNFEIQNFRCSLAQPQKIVETLQKLSTGDFDIVAIMRGGGDSGLELLNNPIIAAQAIKLKSIFISALGHDIHDTLLDKIADKKFSLPLHFGVKLREIVERANEDLTNSKSALLNKVRTEVAKSFADTLKANEEQVKLLKEQLKNSTESNLEKDKYYTKLIEDRVSKIYKDNQNDVRTLKQEHKTSQYIALVIGFALAMLIVYIFKS
jgi:hypothetical protein